MKNKRLILQWMAWRDDYRCARPPVSCQGCDTYYPQDKHPTQAVYDGFVMVECSECKAKAKGQTEPEILFPHVYRRVNRDVVCRYIQRFGGSTFSVPIAHDDIEIYLRDTHGRTIATVSLFDKFPKPVEIHDDIPF